MKKYNKPEIEALALETLDVIALSNDSQTTVAALGTEIGAGKTVVAGEETIVDFVQQWNW